MKKIVSWNVNGLRSVQKKGLQQYWQQENPDLFCLQEIKAHPDDLDADLCQPKGYKAFWNPAEKAGYSGLVVYSRLEPEAVQLGLGDSEADAEGRVLSLRFKNFTLINSYFPNSQRDHARLPFKLRFCKKMWSYLAQLHARGENIVLCGDFNIAHREIDLRNPKTNVKNAGFLPEERAQFDALLSGPFVDVFREFEKGPEHYTWWSYRPGVRAKNVGWRLDYFVSNKENLGRIKSMQHRPEVMGSDHCPIVLNLK